MLGVPVTNIGIKLPVIVEENLVGKTHARLLKFFCRSSCFAVLACTQGCINHRLESDHSLVTGYGLRSQAPFLGKENGTLKSFKAATRNTTQTATTKRVCSRSLSQKQFFQILHPGSLSSSIGSNSACSTSTFGCNSINSNSRSKVVFPAALFLPSFTILATSLTLSFSTKVLTASTV